MAKQKKILGYINLQLQAGKANPAPPVGPALGQHGLNIAGFCKEFNDRTVDRKGEVVPVVINVYEDRTYDFIMKVAPASELIKQALKIKSGAHNPLKEKVGTLTKAQLRDIYQGKITSWSQVGGANLPIKVINRALTSGTREAFQDMVLLGQSFAPDGANFITWERDETTAILRELRDNAISYATISQVEKQEVVRIIAIDGINPTDVAAVKDGKYPISRSLFLAVKKTTSPITKQFIDFALSPEGQKIVQRLGFIPI
jgi:50S ribosomal protein uL11